MLNGAMRSKANVDERIRCSWGIAGLGKRGREGGGGNIFVWVWSV